MAYTIVKSDGTTLTTIANGTINTSSTSISLPGRNYAGYGEYLDTNFVHMLENFADSSVPANPIRGQLWYNTTSSTMYICPTDGDTNSANWYAVTTTSSAGNASLGNLTVTGNILTNNITATNKLDANSISCNYLTANINANMANANFSGTANASIVRSIAITSGSQSTTGILTGVWTANGAGTPSGGPSGTAFYVTGGNLVIANTSSRGIVADYFYYGNGTPITFGGSYGNSNVAAYLPGYGGAILTTTTTATALTTGAAGTAGTLTGNWTLSGGSKLQANTVLDAAQSNITSVGVLTSLSVTGNITAASANIVGGNIVAGSGYFLKGDGGLLTNISAAAGTSIVNGTSNVVVDASGNTRIGIAGTSNVLVVASGGANITGYANVTTNAFIGGNANVVSNVNAGNFVGIFANGTSNVRMPASGGNVNLSVGGTSNVLVVTSTGVNVAGYANVTGTVFVGANANIVGNTHSANFVGPLANGLSNVNVTNNGNIALVRGGTTRLLVTGSGANITGTLDVSSNLTVGNANLGNLATANFFSGDGGLLTNISAVSGTAIINGSSNVSIPTTNASILANTGGVTRLTIANTVATFAVNVTAGTNSVTAGNLIVSTAANIPLVRNGNSNVNIVANGNVAISVAGTSNILLAKSTGVDVTGTLAATSTVTGGNLLLLNSYAGATEGAQITLAYANTSGITGGSANTWNVDVATANSFRIFRNTAGSSLVALDINESTGNFTVTGNILSANNIIAYSTSDSRLKENIVPIENALDKIKKISGVMFDWKDGHEIDRKHDTGLIAQEVEAVLPEVVVTRPNGFKAVRYEKVIGLVVQAIKELADQVDELKKR